MSRLERVYFAIGLIIISVLVDWLFRGRGIGIDNVGTSFGLRVGYVGGVEALVLLTLVIWQKTRILSSVGIWLIFTGGVANLLCRIISGSVWDYIKLAWLWFNIPDIMVFAGVVIIISNDIWKSYGKMKTS